MKEGIFMKKLLVPVILMMALLAGCGNAGNDSLVNKDYTIDSSDNNEAEVTTPAKNEEQQTTSVKNEEQQTTSVKACLLYTSPSPRD